MTTYKQLTALEMLADCSSVAVTAAQKHREAETVRKQTDMRSYREGEAAAYSYSHKILRDELARLKNAFQNGHLSLADFGPSF